VHWRHRKEVPEAKLTGGEGGRKGGRERRLEK